MMMLTPTGFKVDISGRHRHLYNHELRSWVWSGGDQIIDPVQIPMPRVAEMYRQYTHNHESIKTYAFVAEVLTRASAVFGEDVVSFLRTQFKNQHLCLYGKEMVTDMVRALLRDGGAIDPASYVSLLSPPKEQGARVTPYSMPKDLGSRFDHFCQSSCLVDKHSSALTRWAGSSRNVHRHDGMGSIYDILTYLYLVVGLSRNDLY